jgi:hypothetical protein
MQIRAICETPNRKETTMASNKFEIGTVYAQSHTKSWDKNNWKCIGRKETAVDGRRNPVVTLRMARVDANGVVTTQERSFRVKDLGSCESIVWGSWRYPRCEFDSRKVVTKAAA